MITSTYKAYLEVRDDGRTMGHVLDLPGCFNKAPNQDEAIAKLREAIREYRSWLSRHGEEVTSRNVDGKLAKSIHVRKRRDVEADRSPSVVDL